MTRKPKERKGVRLNIVFKPEIVAALDEWRRKQSDPPSRPMAVRRILMTVLKVKER